MNLFILYLEFFKTGLFAVGGGLATIPFFFQMAETYEWLDYETVGNFLAIAQSAPGAIGINMASLTGFKSAGIAGSVISALGLVSPAIIIIIALSHFLKSFNDNKIVVSVFAALRPAAFGLLACAFFLALKLALYDPSAPSILESFRITEFILFVILFLAIIKLKGHPVIYVAAGAAAGIIMGIFN
ncbi:MAG: chromate transporter [Treponema sp.]|nr:chromate transporter [Treponema sp.]